MGAVDVPGTTLGLGLERFEARTEAGLELSSVDVVPEAGAMVPLCSLGATTDDPATTTPVPAPAPALITAAGIPFVPVTAPDAKNVWSSFAVGFGPRRLPAPLRYPHRLLSPPPPECRDWVVLMGSGRAGTGVVLGTGEGEFRGHRGTP